MRRFQLPIRLLAALALGAPPATLSAGCEESLGSLIPDATGSADVGAGGGATAGFTFVYDGYLSDCSGCHAPGAPGVVPGIETSLDLSTRDTAWSTITAGSAAGLVGNQGDCNGVPFVGATASQSLIVAVLDEDTRFAFDDPSHPGCDVDAISDMALRVGSEPSADVLSAFIDWVDSGAPDD